MDESRKNNLQKLKDIVQEKEKINNFNFIIGDNQNFLIDLKNVNNNYRKTGSNSPITPDLYGETKYVFTPILRAYLIREWQPLIIEYLS